MAKSRETFGKKDRENKRKQKLKTKQERKDQRQADSKKGQNGDEMLAYVDENGNLSSTPPDRLKIKHINVEDIQIGVPKRIEEPSDVTRNGIVEFFNEDKGYGFIKDIDSQKSVFTHVNNFLGEVRERDKVTFEIEMGQRGPVAVRVKKI